MNAKSLVPVAVAASLAGLAAGIDSVWPVLGISDALCTAPDACVETAQSTLLAAPVSAWMTGLFLGLTWVSVSLWRRREGYQGAGMGLALWGIATVILLGGQLDDAADATILKLGMAAAAAVAAAGLASRDKEAPSRATGAIAACATAALLTGGTLAQADTLRSPWTDLDEAPELARNDTVLQGSINAPHHVVVYVDLSDRTAQRQLAQMSSLSKTDYKITIVPLATNSGEDLAVGLSCAQESGQGGAYTVSVLRTPSKTPMELAIGSRLSAASFKACSDRPAVRSRLKSRLAGAKDLGIQPPFGIVVSSGDTWSLLSSKQPYLSQITKIAKASREDS